MADEEEREVRRCVLAAAEAQMERINLKLQHLETLETVVESERKKQVVGIAWLCALPDASLGRPDSHAIFWTAMQSFSCHGSSLAGTCMGYADGFSSHEVAVI